MTELKQYKKTGSGKVFLGMLLLVIGSILLLDRLGFFLPHWLISWPMFLIALGLHFGIRDNFRSMKSYVLIIIGIIFLMDRMIPGYDIHDFIWPVILISFGLYMIVGRNRNRWKNTAPDLEWDKRQPENPDSTEGASEPVRPLKPDDKDFVDSVSIFGGIKKNIVSKDFKGGDIVNFMGGCEPNLSQADINGIVVLDVTQVMGGTKIIVPPHWEVHQGMTAIFGGVEDKRPLQLQGTSSGKILMIRGTSIFGGIDIRSY